MPRFEPPSSNPHTRPGRITRTDAGSFSRPSFRGSIGGLERPGAHLSDTTNPNSSGTQLRDHSAALPRVPGYTVSRELAHGGMGVVYLAYDPVFGREVVDKVMHPGYDVNRFVVETRVTAQLSHSGIPPIYTLGMLADGRPFLAMKLIEGRPLADELKSATPESLPRLIGPCERLCETIGFAHSRGIVHRNLKPGNVMIGPFGEVLVMGWGLAKEMSTP